MAAPAWLLAGPATQAARSAPQAAPAAQPDDEAILSRLAGTTLSGLEKVGNTFDTPGSMVRDLIGGVATGNWSKYNPVDQLGSIAGGKNRVTFRDDILPDLGIMRPNRETGLIAPLNPWSKDFDPGEFLRDLVGFGLDVATDPLSWLNPFGAATKGGSMAARSGIKNADIMRAANREFGTQAALWGPREAAMHVTPRQLLSHKMGTKRARDAMEDNLRRFAGPDTYDRPLRGGIGTGFLSNKDAIGTSHPAFKWLARQGDNVERFLDGQYNRGGIIGKAAAVPRWLHGAFNPAVGDTVGRGAQQLRRVRTENRRRMRAEAAEALNEIKTNILRTQLKHADSLADALPGIIESQSKHTRVGDVNLGDVVYAADRGNFGHVIEITDDATSVRFVNPQTGDVAIKKFDHASGFGTGSPKVSKQLERRHAFDSKEARDIYAQSLDGKLDEIMTWMAENVDSKGRPDFRGAIRRHMPELLRSGNRVMLKELRDDLSQITRAIRETDDKYWAGLKSYGVPARDLPEWMQQYAIDSAGNAYPKTGNYIRHVARFANLAEDGITELSPEKAINTWTDAMTGRRDVLRSLPKSIVNQVVSNNKYREGGWQSLLADPWVRPYLDADFKHWVDGPDGKRVAQAVLDDDGTVLTGAKAHAKKLHEYLKDAPREKIFTNRMMDDFERHLQGVARASADARSVFDVLQDQRNWRIPGAFDRIVVRPGGTKGGWEIVGKVDGKPDVISHIEDFEAVENMIGGQNAKQLRKQMKSDPDASFTIEDTKTLPAGATGRSGMSGGTAALKALNEAGLRTDVGKARFVRESLMQSLESLDIDPEIAEAVSKAYKRFERPEVLDPFLKLWDNLTQHFKNAVTVPFPAFAVRNLGSGQMMNIAASGEVSSLKDLHAYIKHAREMRDVMVNPQKHIDILGELDAHDVIPKDYGFDDFRVRRRGVSASGLRAPDAPGFLSIPNIGRAWKDVGIDMAGEAQRKPGRIRDRAGIRGPRRALRAWSDWGNRNNQAVEFMNRASLYNYLRKHKGFSAGEAAAKVRELQFDYSDITMTDAAIKRVVPFYTFSKKMAEAFVRSMFKTPQSPMMQSIKSQARHRDPDKPLPEHIATGTAIPIENTKDGEERYLTGLGMAWEDPLQLLSGDLRNTLYEAASRSHPYLKAPFEYMTNQSMFQSGRSLDDMDPTSGRLVRNVQRQIDPSITSENPRPLGPLMETILSNSPIARAVSTAKQVTDTRRGKIDKAFNLLTGVRTSIVNEDARNSMLEDAAEELLRQSGARKFDRVYFRPEQKAMMSPEQRAQAEALMRLLRELGERAKERQRANQAGPSPFLATSTTLVP